MHPWPSPRTAGKHIGGCCGTSLAVGVFSMKRGQNMNDELGGGLYEDLMSKPDESNYSTLTCPTLTWAERRLLAGMQTKARDVPGQTYREVVLAREFNVTRHEIRYIIGSLVRKGRVRKTSEYGPQGTPMPFYAAILDR